MDFKDVDSAKVEKLSKGQKAIWELKSNLTGDVRMNKDIATQLGVSVPYVCKTLSTIYRRLGISRGGPGKKVVPSARGVEYRDPEAAAAMLDAGSDPLQKVKDALRDAGMPDKVSDAMLKRLRVKFFGAHHEIKSFKTQEIIRMCEEKLGMINFYLDDKVMAEANARDLGLIAGVLIEKRALLRGEPTQIINNLERENISKLVPMLIAEAQRRGRTIDVTPNESISSPT